MASYTASALGVLLQQVLLADVRSRCPEPRWTLPKNAHWTVSTEPPLIYVSGRYFSMHLHSKCCLRSSLRIRYPKQGRYATNQDSARRSNNQSPKGHSGRGMASRAEARVCNDTPAEFAPPDAYIPLWILKRRTVRGQAQVEDLHTRHCIHPPTHTYTYRHTHTYMYTDTHAHTRT
jgi:hypothetical protein